MESRSEYASEHHEEHGASLYGGELTHEERAILCFEEKYTRGAVVRDAGSSARKDDAIVGTLGISPVRYYYRLNQLVDSPAALRAFPQLIRRLERTRQRREHIRGQ